jgi:hypothetical protein
MKPIVLMLLLLLSPTHVIAQEIYLDCVVSKAPTERMSMDKLFKHVPKDEKYIKLELYRLGIGQLLYCYGTKWVIDTDAKTIKLVSNSQMLNFKDAYITEKEFFGRYQFNEDQIRYMINIDRRFGTLTLTKYLSDSMINNWLKAHGKKLERSWVETQQCTSSVDTKF